MRCQSGLQSATAHPLKSIPSRWGRVLRTATYGRRLRLGARSYITCGLLLLWVSLGLVGIDRLQAHPSRSRSLMYFPRHDFSPRGARDRAPSPPPICRNRQGRHCIRRPRGRSGLRVLGSPNLNDVDSATRPAATRGGDDHTSKSGVRAQRRLSPLRLRGTSLVLSIPRRSHLEP